MEFVILGNDSRRFRSSVRRVYGTVYDQKSEGICLPIAMATATTIAYILKYGYLVDISPQPFIDLGVRCFMIAKLMITDKNFALQQHCDYQFIHIPGPIRYQRGHRYTLADVKIVAGYENIRDAIIENFGQWGPRYALVACVDLDGFVHDELIPFRNRTVRREAISGTVKEEEDLAHSNVGHAVVITGVDTSSLYDEEHSVEIRNSHGHTWGEEGHSRVTYHFFQRLFVPVMRGDIEERKQHRHPLDLYTIDHTDSVNDLCFSADGRSLATVCNDGIARIFELDDFSRENFRFKSINMRRGCRPTGVVFVGDSSSSVVVATRGAEIYLHMYEENSTGRDFSIKWDKRMAHNGNILTLFGALAAEGSTTIVSSDGTNVRLWRGETGQRLGTAEVYNDMACISPNGLFVAAASLNIVKVWKIVNSSVTSFATLKYGKVI